MFVRRVLPALVLLSTVVLWIGAFSSAAQDRGDSVPRVSPNATVSQTIGITDVRITYGRPSVNDRTIFSKEGLVPFGNVWRTGANEATTISFSTPVHVQGESLDAGTYGFFTIPGPDTWTLIFNETANQWGAYNYDSNKDVLRVEVEPQSAEAREMLTFSFHNVTDTSATAHLHWSETLVPFTITVNTQSLLQSQAEEAVAAADDWREPLRYVGYALQNDVLLEDALEWINRSLEIEEHFTNLRLKANVLAALDQYSAAVETGNAALSTAESMTETPDGVEELRGQMENWKSEM
jgi:hypothetical protein